MDYAHEPYCDENHGPRQRCNSERLSETAHEPVVTILEARAEHLTAASAPEPPPSDAIRSAVRAAAMPAASPYATLEAERLTSAVGDGYEAADASPYGSAEETGASSPRTFILVAGVVLLLLFLLMRRRSSKLDEAGDDD